MKRIGILGYDTDDMYGVKINYLEWIRFFGYPTILNQFDFADDDLSVLDRLDAIVLPGGPDISPQRYDAIPEFKTGRSSAIMEFFDLSVLPRIKIPIFGICRGLQTINVMRGGTLYQDIDHPVSGFESQAVHDVFIPEEKKPLMRVNSFHHQAIDVVGEGLRVELISGDGYIEAISGDNLFAVQWHPERLLDEYSIRAFSRLLK